MGQVAHIRNYALLRDECELVALAEPRPRTAELVASRYGIDRVYRDHRELLDSERLDGIVAAQRFTHHAALLPELYPYVPHLFTEEPRPPEFADDATSWALWNATDKLVHPLNLLRHFLGERYLLAFVDASGRLLAFESESGITATIEVTPYRRTVGFDEELLVAFE